jgi:hypothetical protein
MDSGAAPTGVPANDLSQSITRHSGTRHLGARSQTSGAAQSADPLASPRNDERQDATRGINRECLASAHSTLVTTASRLMP